MRLHLPRILAKLTRPDGPPAIELAPTIAKPYSPHMALVVAGAPIVAAVEGELPSLYTILGYRQTEQPACRGGRANANFFRIRHKAMRAFARTFKGQPFISGHDWGDVRARGGTITKGWAMEPAGSPDELGVYCELELLADWAKQGFADGTIDRFSMGAFGLGEISCTVHDAPLWSDPDCACWPGYEFAGEGQLCELEYEDARGVEMSGVNVPAVDGTEVVDDDELAAIADLDPKLAASIDHMQKLCGRSIPGPAMDRLRAATGGAPRGGFPRAAAPITMTAHAQGANLMDRALVCQMLGLPVTATDEEIQAKARELGASAAQVGVLQAQLADVTTTREREQLTAHVEAEITRLRAARQVGDQVIASLRATATAANTPVATLRANFDASIRLVEASAPIAIAAGAAPLQRAPLQSDAPPATAITANAGDGPDAYEHHKSNPHLPRLMKRCGVTAQNVREHGTALVNVVPELKEKIAETDARGAA